MNYNCIEDELKKMESPAAHGYETGINVRIY